MLLPKEEENELTYPKINEEERDDLIASQREFELRDLSQPGYLSATTMQDILSHPVPSRRKEIG